MKESHMWVILIALVIGALVFITSGCGSKKVESTIADLAKSSVTNPFRIGEVDGVLETVHWGTYQKPIYIFRIKVPDGWLVVYDGEDSGNTIFYADPEHQWTLD